MGLFMWRQCFKILLYIGLAFVLWDVSNHKRFQDSKTGVFLQNQGLLEKLESALSNLRKHCKTIYWWIKLNAPEYIASARKIFVPYLLLAKNILISLLLGIWNNLKLLHQYIVDNIPLLKQWMNSYSPGLSDTIYHWAVIIGQLILECVQMLKILIFQTVLDLRDLIVHVYTTQVVVAL